MRICLDTNVYCRPFDDQSQKKIQEETDAFEEILEATKEGKLFLLSSDILVYEVSNILSFNIKTEVVKYLSLCKNRVEEGKDIKDLAIVIRDRCSIKDRDALHLASAIIGKADYFLTCDNKITARKGVKCVEKISEEYGNKIRILSPVNFEYKRRKYDRS
ncbi:MAG: PIN domain-containing protein [Nitrospinota bacterium]